MQKSKRILTLALSLILIFSMFTPAFAAVMKPDYEVKFVVDPDLVLDANGNLLPSVRALFNAPATVRKISQQYIDTDNKTFDNIGWLTRIRFRDSDKDFQLLYRKRYPIATPVTTATINATLAIADNEGFTRNKQDNGWDAQVDWSYDSAVLSISFEKSQSGGSHTLPNLANSRTYLNGKIPNDLDRANGAASGWGKGVINTARIYGPVTYNRYTGKFQGNDIDLEVMQIKAANGVGMEYIVEFSFKNKDFNTASSLRTALQTLLQNEGILLPQSALKTSTILERY